MPNHFHLLDLTEAPYESIKINKSKMTIISHAKSYNKPFNRMGSLFLRACKIKPIGGEVYTRTVIMYISIPSIMVLNSNYNGWMYCRIMISVHRTPNMSIFQKHLPISFLLTSVNLSWSPSEYVKTTLVWKMKWKVIDSILRCNSYPENSTRFPSNEKTCRFLPVRPQIKSGLSQNNKPTFPASSNVFFSSACKGYWSLLQRSYQGYDLSLDWEVWIVVKCSCSCFFHRGSL